MIAYELWYDIIYAYLRCILFTDLNRYRIQYLYVLVQTCPYCVVLPWWSESMLRSFALMIRVLLPCMTAWLYDLQCRHDCMTVCIFFLLICLGTNRYSNSIFTATTITTCEVSGNFSFFVFWSGLVPPGRWALTSRSPDLVHAGSEGLQIQATNG